MTRPHLLFVSPRFLFPMDEGGKIRSGNILKGLKTEGGFEVTLASPAPALTAEHQAQLAEACDRFIGWTESRPSGLQRAVSLASALPVAAASDRSEAGRRAVAAALDEKPDVVVCDFPHADVLMPSRLETPSVLFTHNVEAEIFEGHVERADGLWRRIWANQARKMDRFERTALGRYDTVIAVSARDQRALTTRYGLPSVETIDTGVDLEYFARRPLPEPPVDPDGGVLVFTATMSWTANVDAIHFLLDEVWPRLVARRPGIRAVIIGRDPPTSLADKVRRRGLNVTLTGYVDDIRPYVSRAHVYVIPLLVGSGTRIKAFEAMAMGLPVVSTPLGVAGLDLVEGEHFIGADSPEGFASAILELLDDPGRRGRLADAARQLLEDRFSWRRVARQFESICRNVIRRPDLEQSAGPQRSAKDLANAAAQ